MSKTTSDIKDIMVMSGVAVAAWYLYKYIKLQKEDPGLIADTSAAKSLTQQRENLEGEPQEQPYVSTGPSPYYPGETRVFIYKDAPIPGRPDESGRAATSMSEEEWSNLDENDKRAVETGQFTVTDQGMLITGTNRLISLLPGSIIQFGTDLGSRIKDLSQSNIFGSTIDIAKKFILPLFPPFAAYEAAKQAVTVSPEIKSVETPLTELRVAAPRIKQATETVATKTLISSGPAPDPRFAGTQESLKYARGF